MNENFIYREDPEAMQTVLKALHDYDASAGLIRLALSLEAVIAGGAAIALFEASLSRSLPATTSSSAPARRWTNWRDIDLWFPNEAALNTFIATAAIDKGNVRCNRSYGGHALDIRSLHGGPQLQVITFRVGNPVDIISQFDFINCAVAFDGKGFWYHKDVPELAKQKKLSLQNDNSQFFLSRVSKYVSKGYFAIDDQIRTRLFKDLCELLDTANEAANKAIVNLNLGDFAAPNKDEYDAVHQPIINKLHQAETVTRKFLSISKHSDKVLTPEQMNALKFRFELCETHRNQMGEHRRKRIKLPYGYYGSTASKTNDVFMFED